MIESSGHLSLTTIAITLLRRRRRRPRPVLSSEDRQVEKKDASAEIISAGEVSGKVVVALL